MKSISAVAFFAAAAIACSNLGAAEKDSSAGLPEEYAQHYLTATGPASPGKKDKKIPTSQ